MVALPSTNASAEKPVEINTGDMVCDFGKHKGELYANLPEPYLEWMISADHSRADFARAELKRRASIIPATDISGRAIDDASTSCRHIWDETRMTGEGVYSWLSRTTKDAIENAESDPSAIGANGHVYFRGMFFAFDRDAEKAMLKTIYPKKKSTRVDWAAPVRRRLDRLNKNAGAYSRSKGNW